MSLPLFLARRIYRDRDAGKQVSRPAVLIALIGVAIGLAVMIITVSVIVGFKSEVRGKVIGFGSDIQITNSDAARSYETRPVVVNDSVISILSEYPEVKHVQRYSTKPGMVKTAEDFQGMVLKVRIFPFTDLLHRKLFLKIYQLQQHLYFQVSGMKASQ